MKTNDITHMLDTVEEIRSRDYPDLDPGFLQAVVYAEERNPDEQDAIRAIQLALKEALKIPESI
jgi:hypothetical protein